MTYHIVSATRAPRPEATSPGVPCVPRGDQTVSLRIRQGYPLNLSISISGGKETNRDGPSNGE